MKKRMMASGLLMVLGFMGSAGAEMGAGPFFSYVNQNGGSGIGGGVKGEWFFHKNIGLDVRASYLTGAGSGDKDSAIPLEIGVLLQHTFDNGMAVYGGGGGGYYIYKSDSSSSVNGQSMDDPDPEFGFYGLVGLKLKIANNISLFAEGKYTKATYEQEETGTGTGTSMEWRGNNLYRVTRNYTYTTSRSGGLDGFGANVGLQWIF